MTGPTLMGSTITRWRPKTGHPHEVRVRPRRVGVLTVTVTGSSPSRPTGPTMSLMAASSSMGSSGA